MTPVPLRLHLVLILLLCVVCWRVSPCLPQVAGGPDLGPQRNPPVGELSCPALPVPAPVEDSDFFWYTPGGTVVTVIITVVVVVILVWLLVACLADKLCPSWLLRACCGLRGSIARAAAAGPGNVAAASGNAAAASGNAAATSV